MKWLAIIALVLAGCDSSAVLANIDTYTCAYLPGAVDCTTQAVHDKAVGLLQHGLVEASIECHGVFEFSGGTRIADVRAQKFADGSTFAGGMYYNFGTPTRMYNGSQVCGRTESCAAVAGFTAYATTRPYSTENSWVRMAFYDGKVEATICWKTGSFPLDCWTDEQTLDISTSCTGYNLEAFE